MFDKTNISYVDMCVYVCVKFPRENVFATSPLRCNKNKRKQKWRSAKKNYFKFRLAARIISVCTPNTIM